MEPGSATHTNEILPADVVPVHYDISIATDFETLTFIGEQKVTLNVQSKTKTIVLNALGLKITSASVGSQQSESIEISEEAETAKIHFASEVGTHGEQITLQLSFTGDLDPNMRGFYKSKREVDGKTNWIAVTQFEPVDARRAFPCWDEPSLKATFAMSLTAPSDMVCLSNMPAKNETDLGNGRKRVDFDTSPKMSTYLVAYCVGNFECVEGQLKSGSKVRVWAVPGKKDQCEYALENGIKILHYYEDYFGIPYPLPKTDMIALPDFQMGAMENWGLITYRETALLCNPATASVAGKSRVVYVIAHELAHQWFGNLVTMAWWKELWLNEGFASFIGSQATAHFYPEWRYWDQFVVSYINSGLKADSSRTSHPIEVEIKTARSVQEIFDVISYQKGASVIKMISDFLGEKVFQKGLQTYLSEHAYGNTVTKDLWDHLSRASGKDVSAAMDNWVKEMGYPVVLVEETGTAGQFKISQRRFLGYGNPTAEEDRVTWNINLAVITESQREIQYVAITQKEQVVTLPAAANEWVKLNAGQSGFYRVQYSSALSQKLTAALSTLSSIDRLGLVNDVFSLAFAGIAPLSQALHLASQYTDETDPGVWGILIDNLSMVYRLFESSQPQLDKLMLKLFSKIGQSLGWSAKDGEDELWKATRPRVLDVLGEHGDPSIIEEAKKRMAEYEKDASSLSLEVASLVFKYWLRSSGADEGKRMIAIYEGLSAAASTSPEWSIKTLACIGYGADLDHSLTYILENDACRAQDFMYPLNCICSTAKGRARAWEFITTNWDRVSTKVSASLLGHVISIITSFSTAERLKEVEEFFSTRANKELERTVKNRLEVIKTNINTVDTQKEKVISYLNENFS